MTDNGSTDKLKGTVNKVKGEEKDQIGNTIKDASLRAEGKFDKLKGEAQMIVGELKDKFDDKDKK
jgi:uncharacterized protein YjbJ (UPF0337 family)